MHHFKFALRQLFKNPGFAAAAVLTLGLGIGANTAIFSVLHAVVLRPFSYPNSDQIMFVSVRDRSDARNVHSFSFPDLIDCEQHLDVFERFGGAMDASLAVTGIDEPARVKGCYLGPAVFDLLRTPPVAGRILTPADNQRGAERVTVLNHAAWQRFFHGAADVIGRRIELDGRPHTVVGVMPAGFKFWDAQVYLPLIHGVPEDVEHTRAAQIGLWGIGRLKPGVTLDVANAGLDTLARRLAAAHPDTRANFAIRAQPLAETVSQQIRPTLNLLLGAVGFVLLIACVNVSSLLLARGASRTREIAVRAALGANRSRIFRQLLSETLPLAVLGAALGVALAAGGLELILRMIPPNLIPAEATVRLSLPVLAFTGVISLLAALLAGVLPAFQSSRMDLSGGLKEGARGTSDLKSIRLRGGLIASEVALALTLLIGAGLLMSDLSRLIKVDPGFRTEGLLVARLDLPGAHYTEVGRSEAFVSELRERAGRLPGVQLAAVVRTAPFGSSTFNLPVIVEGQSYQRMEDMPSSAYNGITSGAIEALGARIVAGRSLTELDGRKSERVILVNEAAARQFFPKGSAVGRRLAPGFPENVAAGQNIPPEFINPPWATVVGVVSDMRQFGYLEQTRPEVFVPYEQSFEAPLLRNQMTLLLRTAGAPQALANPLRQELRALDPNVPTDTIQTMATIVGESVRPQRFLALLLGIFAGVAGLLAALGIYSVVAWTVVQRGREVGIRLALGATPGAVVGRLVRQALQPVGIGIAFGLAISIALARVLSSQLVHISGRDPVTYAGFAAALLLVASLACWLPARRAAKVDPMEALRTE